MRALVVFVVMTSLLSCKSHTEQLTKIISQSIGKQITLPDSLEYRGIGDSLYCPPNTPIKIIVYINGECQSCIGQFSAWAKADLTGLLIEGKTSLHFYVKAYDFSMI